MTCWHAGTKQDGILGEEFGATPGTSGRTWVLDPVDGTRAFLAGAPTWGVLIALADESGPVYGLIDQPYIGERFEGGFGDARMVGPQGTRVLRVRGDRPLAEAILMTTYPEVGSDAEGAAFAELSRHVRLTRYGLDCYAYALLAAGQIDLVVEAGLAAYDIQAPIAVIEAAGGIVTDWRGGPAHQGGRVPLRPRGANSTPRRSTSCRACRDAPVSQPKIRGLSLSSVALISALISRAAVSAS